MAMIEVKSITKSFQVKKYDEAAGKYVKDTLTVLRDFSVNFDQEGVTVLLGPSGTGKSTLTACPSRTSTSCARSAKPAAWCSSRRCCFPTWT